MPFQVQLRLSIFKMVRTKPGTRRMLTTNQYIYEVDTLPGNGHLPKAWISEVPLPPDVILPQQARES